MLDFLGGGDQGRIFHVRLRFLHHLLGFSDQTFHRFTFFSFSRLAEHLEHFFEALDVPFSLIQMLAKAIPQFRSRSRFGHFGQNFDQLLFSVVNVG